MKRIILILAIVCLAGVQAQAQTTRYVTTNGTTTAANAANATSWATACNNLQAVINASTYGDTIFIAKGTYKPQYTAAGYDAATNTYPTVSATYDNAFVLKSGISLYGGFDPTNGITDLSHNRILPDTSNTMKGTILSGDRGFVGYSSDDCCHVVICSDINNTVLNGVTITGGNTNGSGSITVNSRSINRLSGGGMYNYNSSPKLTYVMISGNEVTGTYSYGGGMYNVNSSPELTHVIISKNTSAHSGGGMCNDDSSPILTHVIISENTATYTYGFGGGIYNLGASTFPKLTDVTISGNTSSGYGGGISYSSMSSSELTNVRIFGNTTTKFGGGIYNNASSLRLTDVTISGNTAGSGGGMFNDNNASSEFTDVIFSENRATVNGGGMCNYSSSLKLTHVTISGNTATTGSGGGMYNYNSSPELTHVTISGNTATEDGGGMYNYNSSPELTHVTISGNTATGDGGGIYNNNSSELTDVMISENTAAKGGGIYNSGSSYSSTLNNVTISGNTATTAGGGMYNSQSSPILTNVLIAKNTATTAGGGFYNFTTSTTFPASPVLVNVTISGNMAAEGGGIYNNASPACSNSIIWGNTLVDGTTEDNVFDKGSSFINYSHSLVGGATLSGGITLNGDPLFVDTAAGDYRLLPNSPCINAGDNNLYYTISYDNKDLAGNSRIVRGMIDLGAYEWQGSDNAALASLSVSEGTLTPAFSPSVTDYRVDVANSITSIIITAQTEDPRAIISGDTGTHSLQIGDNTFAISVTAEDSSATETYNIIVTRADDVNIVETRHATSLQIYPNPTTGQLTIDNGQLTIEQISIYDISGRIVGADLRVCPETTTIDVSHLANGIYLVKVKTKEGEVVKKIVKN